VSDTPEGVEVSEPDTGISDNASGERRAAFTLGVKDDPRTEAEALAFALGGVGKGWHPLVTCLVEMLDRTCETARIGQVKEKFGGLRFYCDHVSRERPGYVVPDPDQWISAMEALSYYVCENCGRAGTCGPTHPGGYWRVTLCEECRTGALAKRQAAWDAAVPPEVAP
jgi:hypothetical protein